jgi:hypothetical protein
VIFHKTSGGKTEVDLCKIVNGKGISSNPWIVKSQLTYDEYPISAMNIATDCYIRTYSGYKRDAEVIYKRIAGKDPEYFGSGMQDIPLP